MIAYSFIIGGHDAPINSNIIAILLTDTIASRRPSADEVFNNNDVLNLRYFYDRQIEIHMGADPDAIADGEKEI